jgi:hypothetical protein
MQVSARCINMQIPAPKAIQQKSRKDLISSFHPICSRTTDMARLPALQIRHLFRPELAKQQVLTSSFRPV